jgi:predicted 3-demethylubiquinone-9 3-methyltransferase (glyoxalase superfamily)
MDAGTTEEDAMPGLTPNLWFDGNGEEAAEFYVSIFPNSEITAVQRFGEAGPGQPGQAMAVNFVLDGTAFTIINGGPEFTFSEAVSFMIDCADQDEVDHYWSRLTDGGEESQCGWLKDRFGLSWQVIPSRAMAETVGNPDPARSARATRAMLGMKKLDVAALYSAAEGD